MSLAAALRDCPATDAGVRAEMIPAWIQFSLPMEPIRKQFAQGRVRVRIAEIMDGLEPSFRSLLNNARPDAEVELPVNEVFHALTSAPAPAATPVAPVVTEAPAAEKQIVPQTPSPLFTPPVFASPILQEPVTPAPDPFKPLAPLSPPSWAAEASPEPAFTAKPVAAAAWPPAVSPFEQPVPADPAPAVPAPSVTIPANVVTGTPEVVSPAPFDPTPAPAKQPLPAPSAMLDRSGKASKNLVLRALLGASCDSDVESVVRATGALPGLEAVICMHDGREVASINNGSPDAAEFLKQATGLIDHLKPVLALSGNETTESFSFRNDERMVSFSFQGNTSLCVLHAQGGVEDGLHEKITLIGRELAQMLRESPPFA